MRETYDAPAADEVAAVARSDPKTAEEALAAVRFDDEE